MHMEKKETPVIQRNIFTNQSSFPPLPSLAVDVQARLESLVPRPSGMVHSIEADMHAGVVRVAAGRLLWAVEDMYNEPLSWASVLDTAMRPGVGMKLPEGVAVLGKAVRLGGLR
jgi:hypothetical protein